MLSAMRVLPVRATTWAVVDESGRGHGLPAASVHGVGLCHVDSLFWPSSVSLDTWCLRITLLAMICVA